MRSLGVRIGHRASLYTSGEHVDMNFNSYLVHVNIPCKKMGKTGILSFQHMTTNILSYRRIKGENNT